MTLKQMIIYRPFLLEEVKQDINTMLYNANDMLSAYNKKNGAQKEIKEYFKLKSTEEYLDILNRENSTQLELYTSKRGKYGGTWMCDKLLVDFMMWLSPEFKSKAINFILEGAALAGERHELKEGFKKMARAIADTGHTNFREEATLINVLCTGSPATNQRARLGIDAMKQMDDLQTTNASLIKAGLSLEDRKNILIKSL